MGPVVSSIFVRVENTKKKTRVVRDNPFATYLIEGQEQVYFFFSFFFKNSLLVCTTLVVV